jgi:cytochrome c oxidase subunit 2
MPGHVNILTFRPKDTTTPIAIRGQCKEYCGGTHAQMSMYAIVEPQASFDAWIKQQQQVAQTPAGITPDASPAPGATVEPGATPAPTPVPVVATDPAGRGYQLFKEKGCVGCHAIQGYAAAQGLVGPNLTHVGGRQTIVAGWLTNTPENMQRWLRDPNEVKPDNVMGSAIKSGTLKEDEIAALTTYLQSLK